jgi:hypothetical protein
MVIPILIIFISAALFSRGVDINRLAPAKFLSVATILGGWPKTGQQPRRRGFEAAATTSFIG